MRKQIQFQRIENFCQEKLSRNDRLDGSVKVVETFAQEKLSRNDRALGGSVKVVESKKHLKLF